MARNLRFFLASILASLFFWPSIARLLSLIVMVVGLAAIITFNVQRHIQVHRQGKISREVLARNIVVDVLGILLIMAAVILVAGKVGAYAGQAAGRAWGVTAGILSSLAAGLAVGFGVSLLVRWVWGKLFKPMAQSKA